MRAQPDDHWKLRVVAETYGNQTPMGALVLAIMGHTPNRRPYYKGLATIDKQGVIWCKFYARGMHNLFPKRVPICHVRAFNDELLRLAEKCKMDDREVGEFFSEAKKWIERDERAKSTLN